MMVLCCKRVVSPGKDSEQQTNLPPEPLSSLGSSIKPSAASRLSSAAASSFIAVIKTWLHLTLSLSLGDQAIQVKLYTPLVDSFEVLDLWLLRQIRVDVFEASWGPEIAHQH